MAEYPDTTSVPLQALRIGDVCIGRMPCEVFCEIGLEFRCRAAQQPAFMVELANGSMGYLPTPRQHKLGGYETWLGANLLEPEASDKLLAELIAMSEELKLPAGARLHSFRHYFASAYANSGVPERVTMEWMGHAASEMVAHYYHLHDQEAQRQMNRLDLLGEAGQRPSGVDGAAINKKETPGQDSNPENRS